eukprot:6627056-Pyramimonas_sp.AAC.1
MMLDPRANATNPSDASEARTRRVISQAEANDNQEELERHTTDYSFRLGRELRETIGWGRGESIGARQRTPGDSPQKPINPNYWTFARPGGAG